MPNKNQIQDLVHRYEEYLSQEKNVYFDADQFCELADYYDTVGNLEASVFAIEKGLDIHPDNQPLLIKQGRVLAQRGKYKDALAIVSKLGKSYDFDLYYLLAQCYIGLVRMREAADIIEKILTEEKDDLDDVFVDIGYLYLENNHYKKALRFFSKIKNPNDDIEVLFDMAYCYEMEGLLDKSLEVYNKIINKDAYSAPAWANIGRIYTLKEDYNKAVEAFEFALLEEEDMTVLKLKANCLLLLERMDEAIPILLKLQEMNPDDSQLLLNLAESYAISQMFQEAMGYLEEFKVREGETISYYRQKAEILMWENKLVEARIILSEAIEKFDDSYDLLMLLGDADIMAGLTEDAYWHFLNIYNTMDGVKEDIALLDKLSSLALRLGKYEEALDFTVDLLSADEKSQEFKQRLALITMEMNNSTFLDEVFELFDDDDLMKLLSLFYTPQNRSLYDRTSLIVALKNVMENRTLFKNLKY